MKVTEHFTLEELTKSATAERLRLSNQPNSEQLAAIRESAINMLEPLRVAWGSAIIVSSGFRSPLVNASINGSSKTSTHPLGYAYDVVPVNGDIAKFKKFTKSYFKTHDFDQCIDERDAAGAEWMHIGYKNAHGQHRRQFLITKDGVHYAMDKV